MDVHDKAFIVTLDNDVRCLAIAKNFKEAESLFINEIANPIKKIEVMQDIAYAASSSPISTKYMDGFDDGIRHVVNDILPEISLDECTAKNIGNAIIEWENRHIVESAITSAESNDGFELEEIKLD